MTPKQSGAFARRQTPTAGDGPVVRVERLSVAYGSLVAVRDVSFEVGPGEIFGLVGPNGAGKTSITESVGGLRSPVRSGSISVCGLDPHRDRRAVSRLIGMQLQESQFPSRTRVGELCDLYEAIYSEPGASARLLETFGLADRRRSLITELSGGMRQRLALALAQIGDVRLVILDELTTGLDPEHRRGTWHAVLDLAERGVAVLLTSHSMDEVAALCGRVGVLRDGELIALDTPARLTAAHGGPTIISVGFDAAAGIGQLPEALGLTRLSSGTNGQVDYAARFPTDYDRVVQQVVTAGLPASAVTRRLPTLEDAYLGLVGIGTDRTAPENHAFEKGGD
ncbi:ABC transporter ATP-binding protein [Streptomyces olivochromogenes]|uniref:ABC transporter ATP-binding protein n=1 Tax=Streptomyces olivochromogenes TaxID=1963 RepID=UPI0027E5822C|nr:ABC transporter ATP-binding protein [Streptomyces olivochromogenes]MCF3134683.1 ABC transporter ATP-binding protein [Streptomyces olivochromogenes]